MSIVATIVSLSIFHLSSQGFMGKRPNQNDVTEDSASNESFLYSLTNPYSLVPGTSQAVIRLNDKNETEEEMENDLTTAHLDSDHLLKKRSTGAGKTIEKENDIGSFSQDAYPSQLDPVQSQIVEDESTVPRSEEPVYNNSEQTWKIGNTGNTPYCIPLEEREERGLKEGMWWAAATAILIFAFSNTVIMGATLMISYLLYQVVITALAVMVPGLATVFVKFAALFSFF